MKCQAQPHFASLHYKFQLLKAFLLVQFSGYKYISRSDPDLRLSKNGLELSVNRDAFQVTFVSKAEKQRCSTSPQTFLEKSRVNTSKERKVLQDNPFLQTLLSLAVSDGKKAFSPSFQALQAYIQLVSKQKGCFLQLLKQKIRTFAFLKRVGKMIVCKTAIFHSKKKPRVKRIEN